MNPIASYIDHTLLKPTALIQEIKQLCEEAIEYEFAAVCVPPVLVNTARESIAGRSVKLATVIGFPFGYSVPKAKLTEVQQAIKEGAEELDIVMNIAALKNGAWNFLQAEMPPLVDYIHEHDAVVKIIIESGILTRDEILRCCEMYAPLEVDFLKTSTGYAEKGASVEAVELMRANLPFNIRIKASGGIKTYKFARELVEAGAERLGCSASIAIVQGLEENKLTGY
jgi:deoxyribose-phosphate aldolase